MKISYKSKSNKNTEQRTNEQYKAIRQKISDLSGCERYIQLPKDSGGGIAFSGSSDNPDLILKIYAQENQLEFCFSFNNEEETWYENDFEDVEKCTSEIAERISSLMNRTVKFIKKQRRHAYLHLIEQTLDENGNWITISDNYTDEKLIRPFLRNDIDEEIIKTFSI